jgi:hypothetical protein
MQILEHWDPLNLPRGSVRALITLALLGLLWVFLLNDREVPLTLAFLSLFILGHYFAARGGAAPGHRPPLFLPRGSIRLIIIAGFAAVTYFLIEDGRFKPSMEDRDSAILLLAAALIAGFLLRVFLNLIFRGGMTRSRRWIENLKAVLAIVATAAFIIACMTANEGFENVALVAVPLIVFYFGSREGWTARETPSAGPPPPPA